MKQGEKKATRGQISFKSQWTNGVLLSLNCVHTNDCEYHILQVHCGIFQFFYVTIIEVNEYERSA